MPSHQRVANPKPLQPQASSSRSPQPPVTSSTPSTSDTSSKPFQRIRSSLEHSLRTATRSKKSSSTLPPTDDFATLTPKTSKGKEKETVDDSTTKGKDKSRVLRRLESKVTFRRHGRDSPSSPSPVPPSPAPAPFAAKVKRGGKEAEHDEDLVRMAGFTSFMTPSLRQASMSSPALHLSSQALPSPNSQPAVAASSSTPLTALVSPGKERSRRTSLQPATVKAKEISAPVPLAPKRDPSRTRSSGPVAMPPTQSSSTATREPAPPSSTASSPRMHRSSKSTPAALPTSISTTSLHDSGHRNSVLDLDTPPGRGSRDLHSPSATPTATSGSRNPQLSRSSSKSAAKSSSYLPLGNPPPSPSPTPRSSTPTRARSPSATRTGTRVITPSSPRLTSPSATHLPSTPPPKTRRPSMDAPRPLMSTPEDRTTSPTSTPRRSSLNASSSHDRSQSPAARPRATSPIQRPYAQNRHFNISTTSLGPPPDPEHSEAIRTAVNMLSRQLAKGPWVVGRNNDNAARDWDEVEFRTRNLIRLEKVWGKGAGGTGSQVSLSLQAGAGLGSGGEERLRRVFCEALRDGYVLCQLMNKLRSSSVVRPDPREDGFVRTANVTKFLAACSSYGLASEDLFQRDDLIEASSESLARVANTILALIKYSESPQSLDRSKILTGSGMKQRMGSTPANGFGNGGPYGSVSRAAASTPNLSLAQRSTSPTSQNPPPSPVTARKRYSPPAGLPPVRSDSPSESSGQSSGGKTEQARKRGDHKKEGREREKAEDRNDVHRSRTNYQDVPMTPPKDGFQLATPLATPPSRPPLRPLRSPRRTTREEEEDLGMYNLGLSSGDTRDLSSSPHTGRLSVADSTRASLGDYSLRESIADSVFTTTSTNVSSSHAYSMGVPINGVASSTGAVYGDRSSAGMRQSMASSAMTDTTGYSSLLDAGLGGRPHSNSSGYNKFGTIRTITTEATSEAPSFGREEGSAIAASLFYGEELSRKRTPRSSDGPVVDLSRVAEETDDSEASTKGGKRLSRERDKGRDDKTKAKGKETYTEAEDRVEKTPALRLGKGKWPDDFLEALQAHNNSQSPRPIPLKSPSPDEDEGSYPSSPLSISPPRKLAVIGATRRNESLESIPQFPRRPTHRPRHSIDSPALLPKEGILRRDVSPDSIPSSRVMIRRNSSKPGSRSGVYLPRNLSDDRRNSGDSDSLVPFPRTVSGEHGAASPAPRPATDDPLLERPRLVRGRFQSEIQGESSRKRRPNSYDDLGAKPQRSRFESMVNLGVASNNPSASDLISRDSMDGSAVRRPLIIREEGKLPTHFQLGNCIGRGQFGSVYRALNLNTGQMVAVKRIRLEGLKENEVTQLMREVDLVKSLSHPSIVKYEGMARDEDTLSIVLEYAESGSLVQTLKAFGKLNESLVAGYVVKILEGLDYLHQSGVVHCDLKAANILTTKTGNVKLADFGVSLNMRAMEREMTDVAGTPNWMAPEVIELKGASPKSDIWSLGCTVIELLTGRPPYAEMENSMSGMFFPSLRPRPSVYLPLLVMFRIVEDAMPPIPEGCSPICEDFLKLCFNKDPEKRPGAEMLCEHPWLQQNYAALKDLRPQDSIPFLRRVSQDMQSRSDALRYLANLDSSDAPVSENLQRSDDGSSASPALGRRTSHSSVRPSLLGDNEISPREHTFVKTTFSKPMVCRVCLQNVKKSAVLCAQCSLIAHSKCASNAPPTCDLRAQLLLYAHYAEKGNPASVYSNPVDISNDGYPAGPASDVPYVAHSPRTSIDIATPPQSPPASSHNGTPHPPTAFKFMSAFKRSRSSLTPEPPGPPPTATSLAIPRDDRLARGRSGISRKDPKERPQSLSSMSTNANSSLRSAATAAESFNSRQSRHEATRSLVSGEDSVDDETRGSRFSGSRFTTFSAPSQAEEGPPASMPGDMVPDSRKGKKHTKDKSSGNCIVQ
ncbi:hypothetical protein EYR40_008689 [Pleurotus pulmonarius]|nr:hypothetical protein EYR40_008689 [Pleurotus pulmonarius]